MTKSVSKSLTRSTASCSDRTAVAGLFKPATAMTDTTKPRIHTVHLICVLRAVGALMCLLRQHPYFAFEHAPADGEPTRHPARC